MEYHEEVIITLSCSRPMVLTSCKSDDSTTAPVVVDPIVGSWISEGANVAPGLTGAPFNVSKIVATFNTNKSYTVVQTDKSNVTTTFTGTYTNPRHQLMRLQPLEHWAQQSII